MKRLLRRWFRCRRGEHRDVLNLRAMTYYCADCNRAEFVALPDAPVVEPDKSGWYA